MLNLKNLIRLREMVAPLLPSAYVTIQWEHESDVFALVAWSQDGKWLKAIDPQDIEVNEGNAQAVATKLKMSLARRGV